MFVFDGACGFCRRWATWVEAKLPSGTAAFVPFQDLDLAHYGLGPDQVAAASYWIDEQRRSFRGHRSFGRALRRARGPWHAVGVALDLPPGRWVAGALYPLIARNRHRLPAP